MFGPFGEPAKRLLTVIVGHRWSSSSDLVAGVEEVGVRAIAASAPAGASIETELHAFGAVVASDAQLELALGSKLAAAESKVALVQRLLEGKASAETLAILRQLIAHPRGRRIPELVRFAAGVVADQGGFTLATVSVAAPIAPEQLDRLRSALTRQHGRPVSVNVVVDPAPPGRNAPARRRRGHRRHRLRTAVRPEAPARVLTGARILRGHRSTPAPSRSGPDDLFGSHGPNE